MTDDDRHFLLALRQMADACGEFCTGVIENDLSRDNQLALSTHLADIAERIRSRAMRTPIIIENNANPQLGLNKESFVVSASTMGIKVGQVIDHTVSYEDLPYGSTPLNLDHRG